MKETELVKAFLARKPVIVCVYLGVEQEVRRNETPKRGQAAETYIAKHSILWDGKTWEITKFCESHAALKEVKPLAAEFTVMACELTDIEQTDWGNRIRGTLSTIEKG